MPAYNGHKRWCKGESKPCCEQKTTDVTLNESITPEIKAMLDSQYVDIGVSESNVAGYGLFARRKFRRGDTITTKGTLFLIKHHKKEMEKAMELMNGKDDYSVACTKTNRNGNNEQCMFVSWRKATDGGDDVHDPAWYYMNWHTKEGANVSGCVPKV